MYVPDDGALELAPPVVARRRVHGRLEEVRVVAGGSNKTKKAAKPSNALTTDSQTQSRSFNAASFCEIYFQNQAKTNQATVVDSTM